MTSLAADSDDIEQDDYANIFEDPAGFYEPEKEPTFVSYETLTGQVLSLRLIGHSPLWVGQYLQYSASIISF